MAIDKDFEPGLYFFPNIIFAFFQKCFHYLIILMVLENPDRYGDKNYAIDKGNGGFAEEFL